MDSLNQDHYRHYRERGYVFVPAMLAVNYIDAVMAEVPALCRLDRPEVIMENDGKTVRSLMNIHGYCDRANRLVRLPQIVDAAREIIGGDFYIFQCILNLKSAFSGDLWQWHQDLPTYLSDDGMPGNRLLNVLIFMEEVNEFNGPLMLVPGSHMSEATVNQEDGNTTSYPIRALDNDRVATEIERTGLEAPKGPPGSVIFANTNIIHGSAPNISPWGRAIISLTLNSVENKHRGSRRPKWVVMNDFTPVVATSAAEHEGERR